MPAHWLHLIDAQGLHIYKRQQGDCATPAQSFTADEAGHAAFAAWLALRSQHDTHRIVCDSADDACVQERIPHAHGADRRALIARKIGQHFAVPHLAQASSLGREAQGRRDEIILLRGLATHTWLAPWLTPLIDGQHLLHSLSSIAELGAQCLAKHNTAACLLLSSSPAGLRIAYYKAGQLHFSRLVSSDDGMGNATQIANALQQSLHYLHTQRQLNRHDKIRLLLLCDVITAQAIKQALSGDTELEIRHQSPQDLARSLGLKLSAQSSDSRPLLMQLAWRSPKRAQLAPAALRRNYTAHRTAAMSIAASLIFLAPCVALATWQYLSARQIEQETGVLHVQKARADQHYAAWRAQLPPSPIAVEDISSLNAEIQAFTHSSPSMQAALIHVSQALDSHPNIILLSLDWLRQASGQSAELTIQAQLSDSARNSHTGWQEIEAFRQALALNTAFNARLQKQAANDESKFEIVITQQEGT